VSRTLESRLAKLELVAAPTVAPLDLLVLQPGTSLEEAIARDFGGVRPENPFIVQIVDAVEGRPSGAPEQPNRQGMQR
jgi:hypothetical protein